MASQQPPPPLPRTRFRLASIRPPPPPTGSSSNPQPEPVIAPVRPIIRPTFAQPFRPPPPQEPTPPPPPPPQLPLNRVSTPPPPVTTPPPQQLPLNRVSPPPPPVTTPPPQQLPLNRVSPAPPPVTTLPPQQLPLNRVSPPPSLPRSLPELASSRSPPPSLQQLPLNRSSPPQQQSLPSPPPSQPPLTRSSPPPITAPTSPDIKTSSKPNALSPSPPPLVQTTTTTAAFRSPNPSSSPSPSPKIRHISHPPSPLTLPPAQLSNTESQFKSPQEPEQKTVLVQQTTEKSKLTSGTSSNYTQHKYVNGSTHNQPKVTKEDNKDNYKKSSDSEDYGMRIITIAGENKGAIMELNPSKKNNDNKNIPRAWNSNGENSKKGYNNDYKPPSSYVNSNVQGINNSIIFNASCTHHDPGVHLSVSRNGNGGRGFHMKEKMLKE